MLMNTTTHLKVGDMNEEKIVQDIQKYMRKIVLPFIPTKKQFFLKGTIGFLPFIAFYWYKVIETRKVVTEEEKLLAVKFFQDLSEDKPVLVMFVASCLGVVALLFCFSYFYIRLIELLATVMKKQINKK